jgi:hypothetical protein
MTAAEDALRYLLTQKSINPSFDEEKQQTYIAMLKENKLKPLDTKPLDTKP